MIVVFGSLNIDMVMQLDKMPRPGETVLCPNYQLISGGKGANQAIAAANTGASVKLFGKVGQDEFGRIVMASLKKTSVDLVGVSESQAASTGCAAIYVDKQGENIIAVASGANLEAREDEIPDYLLSHETTLLVQMETPAEENWKLIRRAKKYGARVLLNLAPAYPIPEDIFPHLDVLILNQVEAALLALELHFEVISPLVVPRRLAARYGITCIVTLGKQGSIACSPDGTWEVKAMDVQVVDTTAAGDAFVGVLAASLDTGMDLPLALRRASVASGLACLHKGAQASLPTNRQIEENLKQVMVPRRTG